MGIPLKRRDYSKIMKYVYGDIIHKILWDNDLNGSFQILDDYLLKIINGNIELESLIISKTLKSTYKDPEKIAHKVLAERIGARDAGNKPAINDRLPYIYIQNDNPKALQGERIETIEFIKENKITPDYLHYITNQIMKPVQQVFALVLEDIDAFRRMKRNFQMKVDTLKNTTEDGEKLNAKISDLRNKEVKSLLFDKYLRETNNMKNNMKSITSFFK